MDTKFDFYDFVAYIIPGALVIGLLYWFCVGFLTLHVSVGPFPDAVWLVSFLAASYFLGHIVQALGAKRQEAQEKKKGWLSEKFLQDGNSHYTQEYKKNLKKFIEQTFALQLDLSNSSNAAGEQRCRQQELFYLCSSLIPDEMRSYADNFRAICALYRSLSGTVFLGGILGVIISLKQVVLFLIPQIMHSNMPKGTFATFLTVNGTQFVLGLAFAIFFFSSRFWLQPRWERYTEYYVDAVYRSFYAWCSKEDRSRVNSEGNQQAAPAPVASSNGNASTAS
jgi:hypothetical protein